VRKKVRAPVRIVAFGGGTGLSTLLRGLKQHIARRKPPMRLPIADLAAVVTVTDDGGSSGRLRREYRILPPGDIRNCLVALSQDETLLGRLFQYRFPAGRGLGGHSFGNLFLTALTNVTGDFTEAVRLSSAVLSIRGRIFPSTPANVTLRARLADGRVVAGETEISRSRRPIRRVWLEPPRAHALPEVLEAIRDADLLLVGPGSLYTSLIPSLLVEGIAPAIRRTSAVRVYVANLMTQPGETLGYSAADHVAAIYEHVGPGLFDWAVANSAPVSPRLLRRYRAEGAGAVRFDRARLERLGLRCLAGELVEEDGVARHDPRKLARLLLSQFVEARPRG
jgi:uncharacterized cofD-like protein